jgi:hypothetical protein
MKKIFISLLILTFGSYVAFTQENIEVRKIAKPVYPVLVPTSINTEKNSEPGNTTLSVGGAYVSPVAPPDANRSNSLQDIPLNLFTGTASYSIPVYNLKEGRLGLNLSLNYTPSQIKPHTVSGWTGLGWDLSGIPTISRIVRDGPDEGRLVQNIGQKGYYFYGNDLVMLDNSQDKQPDIFILNTGSGSYKFSFDRYKNVHFYPDNDIKVEVSHINNPNEIGSAHIAKVFSQFIITLPDGTKYYFSGNKIEESGEIEALEAIQNQVYPFGEGFFDFIENNFLTSAWNCTKIVSAYGEEINFTYENVAYTYYKLAENTDLCSTTSIYPRKINKVYNRSAQISEIISSNIKIKFKTGYENCTTDYDVNPPVTTCETIGDIRLDINGWANDPFEISRSNRLNSIEISDNVPNPTIKSLFNFYYDYFNSLTQNLPPNYNPLNIGDSYNYRLKLNAVYMPNGNNLSFVYKTESNLYYSRLTYAIDHWGYYSGINLNGSLTGLVGRDSNFPEITCTSPRNAVFEPSLANVLLEVKSSSGSTLNFEYEPHTAKNYALNVGGFRIKKIIGKDLIRGTETQKVFSYLAENNLSSGFLPIKPMYFVKTGNVFKPHSDLYNSLYAESGRPQIGYSRVIEQISATDGSIQLGKTITYFDQDQTEGSIKQFPACTTNCVYNPVYFNLSHDYKQGQVLKIENYNLTNQLINKVEYSYTNNCGIKTDSTSAFRNYKEIYPGGFTWISQNYYEVFRKYRIESQTSTSFSRDGTGTPITQNVAFTYKDEMPLAFTNIYRGKHNQVVKTTTNDEEGRIIESLNKIVADFNFDIDTVVVCEPGCGIGLPCSDPLCQYYQVSVHIPAWNTDARAVFESQKRNILYSPIESIQTIDNKIVGASYQNYHSSPSNILTLPKSTFAFREYGLSSNDFTGVYFRKADDAMVKEDIHYREPVSEILTCNNLGMPLTAKSPKGGTSASSYDATGLLPISKTSNFGKPDALNTSYEYTTKMHGVSKIIVPNLTEQRFEYYSVDGKLKLIRDKDNNVLKQVEYNLNLINNGPSSIIWGSNYRNKKCENGQVSLTLGIVGNVNIANVEFSTDAGLTWVNANYGDNGYSFLTPEVPNSYNNLNSINFLARASDNLTNIISTNFQPSCSSNTDFSFGPITTVETGSEPNTCDYSFQVTGLANQSYFEYSTDNINWLSYFDHTQNGTSGLTLTLPKAISGTQDFWVRPAENHSIVRFKQLPTCN